MENHQFSLGQNWWLSGGLCLLSIDYFNNDQRANFAALAAFLKGMERIPRVELLPYNELAGSKYLRLGMTYTPGDIKEDDGTPPDELCAVLTNEGITAQVLR